MDSRAPIFPAHPHAGADPNCFEHRHLRITCRGDAKHPGCGPDQMIIYAYEQERRRIPGTGSAWFLVARCGSCGIKVSSAEPIYAAEFSVWPRP